MRDKSATYFPLVEKYYSSGLSKQIFCEQHGLKICKLDYWRKRYEGSKQTGGSGFVSLSVVEPKGEDISIHYSDGTRLVLSTSFAPSVVKQFIPAFGK